MAFPPGNVVLYQPSTTFIQNLLDLLNHLNVTIECLVNRRIPLAFVVNREVFPGKDHCLIEDWWTVWFRTEIVVSTKKDCANLYLFHHCYPDNPVCALPPLCPL